MPFHNGQGAQFVVNLVQSLFRPILWRTCRVVERTPDPLEPLLVPTLRILIAVPLAVLIAPLLAGFLLPSTLRGLYPVPNSVGLPFLVAEAITLLLLALPGLAARLGRWFLPVTLFFCTLDPVGTVIAHVSLYATDAAPGSIPLELPVFGLQSIWPLTFFLTIPLIVVAWQYTFRWVLVFAGALLGIDLLLAIYLGQVGSADAAWALLQLAFGRTVVFLANGYLVSRLVAGQRQQRAALAAANRQLVQYALTQEQLAVSRERNRLARELHDTLAHYMSGLVLEMEGIRLLWDADNSQARTAFDNAIGTARSGLVETRRALQALRAAPLADLGLIGAVRVLAENMAARNQWRLRMELPTMPVALPGDVDEAAYRIVQESLANIERHASATLVTLALQADAERLVLHIKDDGVGFDMTEAVAKEKFGILGMEERSRLVGGTLVIHSRPGQGTVLTFTFTYQPGEQPIVLQPTGSFQGVTEPERIS